MGRITYSAVLWLLFLQLSYGALSVFDENQQWMYEYNSNIITKNAVSDEHIAEWSVSGNLKIQSAKNQVIMKLEGLKTSVFNGVRANIQDAKDQVLPAEAQVLSEAFIVHYSIDDGCHKDIHISHQPDEPLWSVNMKRAIASIFQMKGDQVDKEYQTPEASIYGECQVTYKVETTEAEKNIEKTIDYETCAEVRDMDWANVKSYGSYSPILGEMNRIYHYTKKNGQFVIGDIESSANYTYRNMPDVQSSQHILQKQTFKLFEQTDIVDAIDVSKNTKKTTLLFKYPTETDETFGRNSEEKKSQLELIEEFIPVFEEFKNQFQKVPLLNYDIRENVTIDQMYDILSKLDKESLTSLNQRIFTGDNENNTIMQQIFLSILPYVGEDSTVSFIKDLLKKDQNNNVLMVKLLATFPIYSIPSAELVKEMEILMDIPIESQTVKTSALLSFATLVAFNHEKGTISDKMLSDYQQQFMQLYRGKDVYVERMAYLLGLINLATGDDKLTVDYIIPIACDTNESQHLRVLAMHSFARLSFSEKNKGELYDTFWPIVRNQSEIFEVRIAALEMLLSNLPLISKENFDIIIDSYDEYQIDHQDKHIQNYIYTKHTMLQDEPYYKEFMTNATAIKMKSMKNHKSMAAWTTGNYYMGYTDEANNFGNSLYTKFVANPISNAVNLAEISYSGHAMSLDLGTYTIYLKFSGPMEKFFGKYFLENRFDSFEAILELLELIEKNEYKLKDIDIHVEIAVFVDNRAILAFDEKNNPKPKKPNDIKNLILSYASVSWPISNVNLLVSDLGTPIQIENEILVITTRYIIHNEEESTGAYHSINFKYRNLWRNSMILKSYNPIADMAITTYKIINKERQIQLPFRSHKINYAYLWKPEKDTLIMTADDLIGTYADEEIEHYCANCDMYNELPLGEVETLDVALVPIEVATGMAFNLTRATGDKLYSDADNSKSTLKDMFALHRANSDTFVLAKPLLYYWHYIYYVNWLGNDVDRISLRSLPFYNEPTENTVEFNITEYIYYENDIFEKVQFDTSLVLTNRKVANSEQTSYFNASYQFVRKPKTGEDNTKSQIVDKHFAQVELTGQATYKMCIDREISYPKIRPNKYSIVPIEPTKGKTSISWGTQNKESDTCQMDKYIKISEIYSATDERNQKVRDTKEYKKCKQESTGLKYTPPTDACLAVFKMMSVYDLYTFYGDFRHAGRLAQAVADLEHTNYGLKLLEIERYLDNSVNFTYSKDFVKLFIDVDKHNIVSRESITKIFELIEVNPSDESYDDNVINYGVSENCYITPNNIKTFTGKSIQNYEADYGTDFVALIECINNTRAGLTVQRINDKKIGFTLISDGNEIIATVVDDKLMVKFNGTDLVRRYDYTDEDTSRTYYLDDNTLYVVDNALEVYYNTEYLLIKTFAMYKSYICGACTK